MPQGGTIETYCQNHTRHNELWLLKEDLLVPLSRLPVYSIHSCREDRELLFDRSHLPKSSSLPLDFEEIIIIHGSDKRWGFYKREEYLLIASP